MRLLLLVLASVIPQPPSHIQIEHAEQIRISSRNEHLQALKSTELNDASNLSSFTKRNPDWATAAHPLLALASEAKTASGGESGMKTLPMRKLLAKSVVEYLCSASTRSLAELVAKDTFDNCLCFGLCYFYLDNLKGQVIGTTLTDELGTRFTGDAAVQHIGKSAGTRFGINGERLYFMVDSRVQDAKVSKQNNGKDAIRIMIRIELQVQYSSPAYSLNHKFATFVTETLSH